MYLMNNALAFKRLKSTKFHYSHYKTKNKPPSRISIKLHKC